MIQFKRVLVLPCLGCVMAAWAAAAPEMPPATAPATAPAVVLPPFPAAAELHQQFDAGKYKDVVRNIAHIVGSKDWQGKKFDKFELLTLKAEAHLKLKETALAMAAFDVASRETADTRAAAMARTMAYLIRHCTGTHYIPRATANKRIPGKPLDERITIDIVDPGTRKEAVAALWQDERNAAEPKFKAATEGVSAQSVLDAAPLIGHLRDFDIAAHGDDNDTTQAAGLISTHGRDLLTTMVDKMGVRVDAITSKAMKTEKFKIPSPGGRSGSSQDVWRRHGLENNEPAELKEMVSVTDKVAIAIKMLNDDLALPPDFLAHVAAEANRVHIKAGTVVNENFGETYYTRPTD